MTSHFYIDLMGHGHYKCVSFYRLLLVGGCEAGDDGASKASCCGITAWRALSGSPHYKLVSSYEDNISPVGSPHILAHFHGSKSTLQHLNMCIPRAFVCVLESEERLPQDSQL